MRLHLCCSGQNCLCFTRFRVSFSESTFRRRGGGAASSPRAAASAASGSRGNGDGASSSRSGRGRSVYFGRRFSTHSSDTLGSRETGGARGSSDFRPSGGQFRKQEQRRPPAQLQWRFAPWRHSSRELGGRRPKKSKKRLRRSSLDDGQSNIESLTWAGSSNQESPPQPPPPPPRKRPAPSPSPPQRTSPLPRPHSPPPGTLPPPPPPVLARPPSPLLPPIPPTPPPRRGLLRQSSLDAPSSRESVTWAGDSRWSRTSSEVSSGKRRY